MSDANPEPCDWPYGEGCKNVELIEELRRVKAERDEYADLMSRVVIHLIRSGFTPTVVGSPISEHKARLRRLTETERQVLGKIYQGKRTRVIAEELGVSDRSVSNYLARIYSKLGIHTRAQAVAIVEREHTWPV